MMRPTFRKHNDRLVDCKSYIGFDDAAAERLREHFSTSNDRELSPRRPDNDDAARMCRCTKNSAGTMSSFSLMSSPTRTIGEPHPQTVFSDS
jgi:hypothetical protein